MARPTFWLEGVTNLSKQVAVEGFTFVEELPRRGGSRLVSTNAGAGISTIFGDVVAAHLEAAVTQGVDSTDTGASEAQVVGGRVHRRR